MFLLPPFFTRRTGRISCVGTHTEDKSSFERRGRVVRHWLMRIEGLGAAQLLQDGHYKTVPLLLTDSQSALAVCKRNETNRVEDSHGAGMLRIHKAPTHDNPADFMTKAMNREKLMKFGRVLNLRGAFFTDLGQPAQ